MHQFNTVTMNRSLPAGASSVPIGGYAIRIPVRHRFYIFRLTR